MSAGTEGEVPKLSRRDEGRRRRPSLGTASSWLFATRLIQRTACTRPCSHQTVKQRLDSTPSLLVLNRTLRWAHADCHRCDSRSLSFTHDTHYIDESHLLPLFG